jgi:HPt (histidine-containing phosphotransfer) domain-containing protein
MSDLLPGVPALTLQFLERARTEIQALRTLLTQASADPAPALTQIARIAHALHGASAAFGFETISELAGHLEREVKLHLQSAPLGEAPTTTLLSEWRAQVATLGARITTALAEQTRDV